MIAALSWCSLSFTCTVMRLSPQSHFTVWVTNVSAFRALVFWSLWKLVSSLLLHITAMTARLLLKLAHTANYNSGYMTKPCRCFCNGDLVIFKVFFHVLFWVFLYMLRRRSPRVPSSLHITSGASLKACDEARVTPLYLV